jgi:hypothetical protein
MTASVGFTKANGTYLLHTNTSLTHILSPIRRRDLVVNRVATLPELRVASVAVGVALGQPLLALPRLEIRLAVHDVDLLQRKGLGLVQEEVDHDTSGQVGAAENEPEAVADSIGGIRGEEADHEVAWDTLAGVCGEMVYGEVASYRASCLLLRERLALLWCGEGWLGTLADML